MEACHFCTLFTATVLIITCSRHRHRTQRCARRHPAAHAHVDTQGDAQGPKRVSFHICKHFNGHSFLLMTLAHVSLASFLAHSSCAWLMAHTNQHRPSQRAKQREREPRHPPVRYVSPPNRLMYFMFFLQPIHARVVHRVACSYTHPSRTTTWSSTQSPRKRAKQANIGKQRVSSKSGPHKHGDYDDNDNDDDEGDDDDDDDDDDDGDHDDDDALSEVRFSVGTSSSPCPLSTAYCSTRRYLISTRLCSAHTKLIDHPLCASCRTTHRHTRRGGHDDSPRPRSQSSAYAVFAWPRHSSG